MAEGAVRVDALLGEIGRSMLDAQAKINADALETPPGPEGLRTGVAISETEIEVKMVFEDGGSGANVRPVTARTSVVSRKFSDGCRSRPRTSGRGGAG